MRTLLVVILFSLYGCGSIYSISQSGHHNTLVINEARSVGLPTSSGGASATNVPNK